MTIGNAKAIDLFANKDNKTLSVQVKSIRNKKSVGWPMMRDKVLDDVLYIFINLNEQSNPDYYIATRRETGSKVKQYSTRGIINLTTLKRDSFYNHWDELELLEKTFKNKSVK